MNSRVSCVAVAGLIACLVIGCKEGKPVPGVKGLPKWEPEPAERKLAEFSKSLDTWGTQIAQAEDKTLSLEKHLDAVEAAVDEFDRVADHMTAVKKEVESAIGSVHFDPPRYDRYRAQAKKEAERYLELLERFDKIGRPPPDAGKKEKDGK